MTTQITLATIEAQLRNTITNSGTILVRLSDEVLAQMNTITAHLKATNNYDESKLDAEQLELAMDLAMHFSNDKIGTKFVDGYLALEDQAVVDSVLTDPELNAKFRDMPVGFMTPVLLVNKILNETKSFAV